MNIHGKSAEVATIFRLHGQAFLESNNLSWEQKNIMKDIMVCRTKILGGHREQCDCCHYQHKVFISCRNRHCPKCQTTVKVKWLRDRERELLPVPYFHLVFTLPHELNTIALYNRKEVLNILFRAVSETLLEFGRTSKLLPGGKVGFLAILHTWDQKLLPHYHIHCLFPAGILSPDGTKWVQVKKNFLFPVKALSSVFRGKFMDYLNQAVNTNTLTFPENTYDGNEVRIWEELVSKLYQKRWVVYAKPALDRPDKVLEYLGRYVHRIAIANYRIISIDDASVTFLCKDRETNKSKAVTIPALEFIRRFMLHTVPKQFMRIRAYGFLSNRSKKKDLKQCRSLIGAAVKPVQAKQSTVELLSKLLGFDITRCPRCHKGKMIVNQTIQPLGKDQPIEELLNNPDWFDTS